MQTLTLTLSLECKSNKRLTCLPQRNKKRRRRRSKTVCFPQSTAHLLSNYLMFNLSIPCTLQHRAPSTVASRYHRENKQIHIWTKKMALTNVFLYLCKKNVLTACKNMFWREKINRSRQAAEICRLCYITFNMNAKE